MKLGDDKLTKLTEPYFLGEFWFSRNFGKMVKNGQKIGVLDISVSKWLKIKDIMILFHSMKTACPGKI
jgi:carbonic anhydrase